MWNGQDSLYGNEWIRYDQSYYKLKVAEDGIYRLPYEQMQSAGIPLNDIQAQQFQLFHLGQEVPIYLSSEGNLQAEDFIEFYGEKNRSELDRHLFTNPDEDLLNPEYSLFTDSSAYFLTWVTDGTATLRYNNIENELTDLPAPEPWYWAEEQVVFTEQHLKRYQKYNGTNIYYSHFDGDGFGHAYAGETRFNLPLANRFSGGPVANLSINLIGNSNSEGHALQIDLNNHIIQSDTFYGPQIRKYQFEIASGNLSNDMEITVRGLNASDSYGVALGKIRYPATFAFSKENFAKLELSATGGSRYLELSGLNKEDYIVLEPDNNLRIRVSGETVHRLKLPARSGARQLVWNAASTVKLIGDISSISFVDFEASNANYLILTSNRLFDDGTGNNWVQAYADYRESGAGGNFRTEMIEIRQLFDQFAYGIDFHPLSIRNGFNFLYAQRLKELEYIFIIGRGQEYQNMRKGDDLADAIESADMLIPSFGYPASDNLLFTTNETKVSPVPVGRLAAKNGAEIKVYLEKVKAVEASKQLPQTVADRAWTKQILHLGGGSSSGEQSNIRNHLNSMATEIEQNTFGGSVKSFFKNSTDVIQNSLSQEIFEYINQGTSIITFFGHSSPGTFDFNIDNPDNYDNKGRYPLILSLGCYSGNIFGPSRSIGERFSFYEDKAAVVFGASRGIGFVSALATFAKGFYQNIGEDFYGQSIGKALKATYLANNSSNWIGIETLVEQFTLHGDPAIRLHPVDGPDYVVDAASVDFKPQLITSQLDSFDILFNLVNLGLNLPDSMNLTIRQELPDGSQIELRKIRVQAPAFSSDHQIRLPVLGREAIGLNTFFIQVDSENEIRELPQPSAEMNNNLIRGNGSPGITLYIVDNNARPIYPPNLSIVGTTPVTLRASTSNATAAERTYLLEIDTSQQFNSPLKRRQSITQKGGIIEWQTDLPFQDDIVYYWRVSQDSLDENVGYTWETSSFSYLKDSPNGWRQGHYWQWLEGDMERLTINDQRSFQFQTNFWDFRIRNTIRSVDPNLRPNGFVNGGIWSDFFRFNLPASLSVVVIDTTGRFWFNFKPGEYGSVNTNAARIASYPFPTSTLEDRSKIITFLEEVIPDDYYVFVYPALRETTYDLNVAEWESDSLYLDGKNIFNVLEKQGAQMVRNLKQEMRPYIYAYRKNKLTLGEKLANSKTDAVEFELALPGLLTEGTYTTPPIGPASKWGQMIWSSSELSPTDTVQLSLYGQAADGEEVILFEQWTGRDTSLKFIDPQVYPYLKAKIFLKDDREFSSAQVNSIKILYEGLPDAALNPHKSFSFSQDTLPQGQPMNLKMAIGNPSAYDLDSLLVSYRIANTANEEKLFQRRLSPLPAGDTAMAIFGLETQDLSGPQTLSINVNPGPEQAEHYLFNNYAEIPFFVERDEKEPVLDVTFDGLHILEGDLVSARPEIEINLTDENTYLLLTDTSLFNVSLQHPDGLTEKISFNDERLSFIPATEKVNRATLVFLPTFEQSGNYSLIVQGKDASGNLSGQLDYRVNFEVIVERMISNLLAYPNPFSTATRFVYTLTGDQAPDQFQIQILTVSGKIIREISQQEFGPMLIGTHQSDFVWDGTDEFGDRLANGVYLYRIKAQDAEGKAYKMLENGTEQFFDRGFGKLVILR